jgi:flagellar assembly protein FliH
MTSSDDDLVVTEQADVLSADEIASAYERWQAPRMVSVSDVDEPDMSMMTVESIEALQKSAQEEGYKTGYELGKQEGYQAGFQSGTQDIQSQVANLTTVLSALNQPLADLDAQVEQDLINLVVTLTRQVVRRELKLEPEHVIGAMRAAMAALPMSDRKLKVFLNPQDIELVKTGLAVDEDVNWQWVEDPMLARGGVRLETADTTIDATVESRITAAINKLLGEERSDEHS